VVGTEAKKLYDDAQKMLDQLVVSRSLQANGVIGFFPANANDTDDVLLSRREGEEPFATFHFLRQQTKKAQGLPNFCLSDFIAPKSSGRQDYMGLFAVTAGLGIEKLLEKYKIAQDDYSEIMVKALADRLAEAFAECLHTRVRQELWGYAPVEQLTNDQLINEEYQGIRPAPGYPACPDHTEKGLLFKLLEAGRSGIVLTESYAMYPASSVSGFYFASPAAKYFGLGKINQEQVKEYAVRKDMSLADTEKWLSPNLSYDI
jgi:5-methyltetrahydrofolate--homocysteine methyltransferase